MGFPRRLKDPNAVLDFPVDWSRWLASGETITAATVTPATGLTVQGSPAIEDSQETGVPDSVVVPILSGGTVGQKYDVTYHITTSEGRVDDRSITVVIKER